MSGTDMIFMFFFSARTRAISDANPCDVKFPWSVVKMSCAMASKFTPGEALAAEDPEVAEVLLCQY